MLKGDAYDGIVNIVSYTGGSVAMIDSLVDLEDFISIKIDSGRSTIFKKSFSAGDSSPSSISFDTRDSNQLLEISCQKSLRAVTTSTGENLLSGDYRLVNNGQLAVVLLDTFQDSGNVEVVVDCLGSYEVEVSVVSDLSAFKLNFGSKMPRNELGRLALSTGNENVDKIRYLSDSGDEVGLLVIMTHYKL